jgi:hypothetical protein
MKSPITVGDWKFYDRNGEPMVELHTHSFGDGFWAAWEVHWSDCEQTGDKTLRVATCNPRAPEDHPPYFDIDLDYCSPERTRERKRLEAESRAQAIIDQREAEIQRRIDAPVKALRKRRS